MKEVKEKKILIVYYSLEGNTRFIARTISEDIDADLLALKPQKPLTSKGFMKYLLGGSQVMMKKKPELLPFDKNPQDYDIIIIGTPVWAWSFAPPLATFFSKVNLKDKKIALFSCNKGDNGKTFERMRKELAGNEILGEMEFFQPLDKEPENNYYKAKEWVKSIVQKCIV